jgi:uncharacterized protein (TIGR04255 family)
LTAVDKLFEAHPKPSDLKIESLLLRYIDAVEFDYPKNDLSEFLREKMKVAISLPDSLFANQEVQKHPVFLGLQSVFLCHNPKGLITVRFSSGQKDSRPALLWETLVESKGTDVPTMPKGFANWIDAAHTITDDWFFKLIEGELERRFSGD